MAGGFGGDDEDFEYDDEVYIEEELDEDDEDLDDEDDEENDEDETEDEEGMDALERKLFEIEERRLEPKLKKLQEKIPDRTGAFVPTILPWEKQTLDKARRHKKLKAQVKLIDKLIFSMKTMKHVKRVNWLINIIMSAWPVLLVGLLIIVAIGVIAFIMPWLFPAEDGSTPDSGSPAFGVTGNDFYGIRSWYRDADKARAELTSEYVMLLSDNAVRIAGNHTIGEYYVTITIADDDYNALKLAENQELSNYVANVAEFMYKADNGGENVPAELDARLDGVKYFGFDESVLQSDGLKKLVADYIKAHYEFVPQNSTVDSATIKGSVDDWITKQINLDQDKYKVRTEKIFVKDYLISGDDKMVENITRHDYVGMEFMAKRDVTFTQLSFMTSFIQDGFEMTMTNAGSSVSLPKIEEMTGDDTGVRQYTYKTTSSQSVGAYDYTALPESDVSIYTLAGNASYADLVVAGESGVYAYNEGEGLVGHFNNPSGEGFLCVEFETLWR